ncbi:uncharacterized protein LOC125230974 [Leguminivora glycinivorella]|uniref:uncharacterized protein LOC125230974 n=1 Tax=Leguminivora glycinivorella TaxID=1035111 RepID=UPI00200F844C|nr:uncharacterized protein LOC125230974 [Leguminivora glycinivorella]
MDTQKPSKLEKLRVTRVSKDNVPSPHKRKCDSTTSEVVSYSMGAQCNVPTPTVDESTNFNSYELKTSQSTQTIMYEKPSLCGATSQLESVDIATENNLQERQLFASLISSKQYLSIAKKFQWVPKHICEQNQNRISELTLIVTLFKIEKNCSLIEIGNQFKIPSSENTKMFVEGIEYLANFFQNLIYLPAPELIEAQLPHEFKVQYPNVQCILHTFQIEMRTPTNALRQAQTWSHDKYGNTLKYLIGCTPNGLVTFVSKGYGGGISDKDILKKSKLTDDLPHNATIMVQWHKKCFVGAEDYLKPIGVRLIRPNDLCTTEPTPEQTVEAEAIKSFRVHLKRMTKQLRQFEMLLEVKSKYVKYMDQILIIACGLVNLQATLTNN